MLFLWCVCLCGLGCTSVCISWNFFWRHQESVHKTPICPQRHHSDLTSVKIELLPLLIWSHSFFSIWQIKISSSSIWYVLAELKMHLLPVANCDRKVFDIMRGLMQCRVHVQACCHYSYQLNAMGLFLLLYSRCPVLIWGNILTDSSFVATMG